MARERKFSTEELFQATKQILLRNGYEGFTFSLLSDSMDVSRGAIYKYYENKDELIIDFMVFEMNQFLSELKQIETYEDFEDQFNFLMEMIFKKKEIHHLIRIGQKMVENVDKKNPIDNKEKLERLPLDLYQYLHRFIKLGKQEGKLKPDMPDGLILGYIFQSIAIPNHFGIPETDWVNSIKEIISHGMFVNNN